MVCKYEFDNPKSQTFIRLECVDQNLTGKLEIYFSVLFGRIYINFSLQLIYCGKINIYSIFMKSGNARATSVEKS